MKREDYIFCIGYQGDTAVVDARAKKRFGSLDTAQLVGKGFFRAAFSSALFSGKEEELKLVIDTYNKTAGTAMKTTAEMQRLLGINKKAPDEIKKVLAV